MKKKEKKPYNTTQSLSTKIKIKIIIQSKSHIFKVLKILTYHQQKISHWKANYFKNYLYKSIIIMDLEKILVKL